MKKLFAVLAVAVVAAGAIFLIQHLRRDSGDGTGTGSNNGSGAGLQENKPPLKPYQLRPDRDQLRIIADPKADRGAQLEAVRKLGAALRRKLVVDAIEILRDPAVSEDVRNDLLTRLEQQQSPSGLLGGALLGMWADQKQSARWRNFCLQHMSPVWELEPDNRGRIEKVLFEVAGTGGIDGATALRSLYRIKSRDEKLTARLHDAARQALAGAEKASDPEAEITALHVLADLGDKSVLESARRKALDEGQRTRIRMAAISVLGRLGGQGELKLLEDLAAKTKGRLKTAAEENLRLLRQRSDVKVPAAAPSAEE